MNKHSAPIQRTFPGLAGNYENPWFRKAIRRNVTVRRNIFRQHPSRCFLIGQLFNSSDRRAVNLGQHRFTCLFERQWRHNFIL